MNKRFASLVLAVLAILGFGLVAATPASAAPLPPDANGYKFWSPSICVDGSAINGAYYRVGYIAQQWNLKTSTLSLDYADDCAAAGYPPSRRMVIGTYNNPNDNACLLQTNTQATYLNGMWRWTNGPGSYINIGQSACVSSQTRRDHYVSMAIGQLLGLQVLNSSGYNSRVMNSTQWSVDNVPLPDQNSANTLDAIYSYAYCQPFGTTC